MKGAYQNHQTSCLSYTRIDRTGYGIQKPELHMFDTPIDFLRGLITDATQCCKIMKDSCKDVKPISMKKCDWEHHNAATECCYCKKPFEMVAENEYNSDKFLTRRYKTYQNYKNANIKVKDHCHLKGYYRGAAHAKCNVKCRNDRFGVDCFFHNGKNYDYHFIINAAAELSREINLDISCIPMNTEKYMAFTIKTEGCKITFKDSMQFMPCSLDKLVETQKKSGYHFKYMKSVFGDNAELLTRKGIFPYEWYDGPDKDVWTCLPPISAFYSKLTKETISKQDYLFAQQVWKKMGCKTFRDYMKVYLQTDVILLAEIFESFRDMCLDKNTGYELDPCHYFTSPGMSWDGALKLSKVLLELLMDENMVLMFEKGIRGGISVITNRHSKANNPYMKDYDKNQKHTYNMYLDMNNLYGGAMRKFLPVGNFKWDENLSKYTTEFILNMPEDGFEGATLMVDMEYPKELHDKHNDYPFAPERMTVTTDMYSPHNIKLTELAGNKPKDSMKLVPNLNNKSNYVFSLLSS
jgi:hypothetical protein